MESFLHDRRWAIRAVVHLWERQDLSEHVKVLAQKTFNSYMSNYTKGDFVLHFPDMPNDVRSKQMRVWAQFTVVQRAAASAAAARSAGSRAYRNIAKKANGT